MGYIEKAEEKYKQNPVFKRVVDSLFDLLKNNRLKSHELDLAVKLAKFKDDIETMRSYETCRNKIRT